MIKSFRDKTTEQLFHRVPVKSFPPDVLRAAQRRLDSLDVAASLAELRGVPGNQLHGLTGKRKGQYSIRINAQWRICFEWRAGNAERVEIADYH